MAKNGNIFKRPIFLVSIFVILIFLIIFLTPRSESEQVTIEEYGVKFVEDMIEEYEKAEYQNFKVIDYKITSLEKLAIYENILDVPVELWSIEYRLKPDNIDNVSFAGGMNEEDGWITEDSSAGKPVMVFSKKDGRPELLGIIWTGEIGETKSSEEIVLRDFLQTEGYLSDVMFPGEHILVKFYLSTGESAGQSL